MKHTTWKVYQVVSKTIISTHKKDILVSSFIAKGPRPHEITSPPTGAFITFVCTDRQTGVYVPIRGRNDLFTKHLLENITKENTDIRNIFQLISDGVWKESNGKQRPLSMNGLHGSDKVMLNPCIYI